MPPRCRTVPINPPEPDLATVVANLQRQLLEQQQETTRLREQLAQINQWPQANEVPIQNARVPPVPEVQPEIPPEVPLNAGVPIAPAEGQMVLPPVREDLLYERFRRMKVPEFEGPTDPIVADNWLIDIQVILDFMRLTEQEKVLCASFCNAPPSTGRYSYLYLHTCVNIHTYLFIHSGNFFIFFYSVLLAHLSYIIKMFICGNIRT